MLWVFKQCKFLGDEEPIHYKPGNIVRVDTDLRFKIEKELGSGCCGVVYKVRQLSNEIENEPLGLEPLALKIIHDPGTHNCETRVLRDVPRHPNVISVYRIGTIDPGTPAIVMEYVPESLKSLGKSIFKDPQRIRSVLHQLLKAIKHLHDHDIVHRDIKPGNILYEKSTNRVVLTDFGHARFTMDGRLRRGSEYSRGTYSYFAPEGLRRDKEQDRSLDIWALGCIMGKLVTGHAIFEERDNLGHMVEHQKRFVGTKEWKDWNVWEKRFPKSMKYAMSFFESMLQIDPRMRPSVDNCLAHEWFRTHQFP